MKKHLLLGMLTLVAGSLFAADSSPKDTVTSAAAALGREANYSWHTTVASPGGGRFFGPSDGKTEKGGYTTISMVRNDATTLAVLKGTNGAINTPDNGWQSFQDATADNGGGFNPTMFLVRMLQNTKTPDQQAAALANSAAELKPGTNGISGNLTETGAKAMLSFGRPGNSDGPTVSNPAGSVTFWVTDGKLVKYEFHISGTISFNGNDRDIDRTTTVAIADVGTTKISVPDEAKKKLE